MRLVRFLRSTETCERTLIIRSSSVNRATVVAQVIHLGPVEVEALARVAGVQAPLLDSP
jgi:hypothetical protein